MNKIVLPDGTYLYSYATAKDYLLEKGFSQEDIVNLGFMLIEQSGTLTYSELVEECNWQERVADSYYCNLRDMGQEITELCDKLRLGKGGTKAQMADKIQNIVDFYVQ